MTQAVSLTCKKNWKQLFGTEELKMQFQLFWGRNIKTVCWQKQTLGYSSSDSSQTMYSDDKSICPFFCPHICSAEITLSQWQTCISVSTKCSVYLAFLLKSRRARCPVGSRRALIGELGEELLDGSWCNLWVFILMKSVPMSTRPFFYLFWRMIKYEQRNRGHFQIKVGTFKSNHTDTNKIYNKYFPALELS